MIDFSKNRSSRRLESFDFSASKSMSWIPCKKFLSHEENNIPRRRYQNSPTSFSNQRKPARQKLMNQITEQSGRRFVWLFLLPCIYSADPRNQKKHTAQRSPHFSGDFVTPQILWEINNGMINRSVPVAKLWLPQSFSVLYSSAKKPVARTG